jgi:hypothetical protein
MNSEGKRQKAKINCIATLPSYIADGRANVVTDPHLLVFAAARVSASHAIFCLLPFTGGDR